MAAKLLLKRSKQVRIGGLVHDRRVRRVKDETIGIAQYADTAGVRQIQLASTEVTILQTDVDVAADRIPRASNQLVRPGAVSFASKLHSGASNTGASVE